jgi:O-methyltransferase
MNSTENLVARLQRLEAERNALRRQVEVLQQRERERKERVERKRASIVEAPPVEPPRFDFERPSMTGQGVSIDLAARSQAINDSRELYLDLLKNCLTRLAFGERPPLDPLTGQFMSFDLQRRAVGSDWPSEAETMAGLLRLDNVQQCVVDVLRNQVPGDLVETGVWRGGITILMRAVLRAYGDTERTVWAADSYAGLPAPDAERYEADTGYNLAASAGYELLAIPVEEVQANFARYGLLDDQVRFLVGWFRDTLPTAPIERIAVLRLDGDLYESTMDALNALYEKLSIGGFLIIDDYYSWEPCQLAIKDFRAAHGINEPIQEIDWTGAYWRRSQ